MSRKALKKWLNPFTLKGCAAPVAVATVSEIQHGLSPFAAGVSEALVQ
jgi:hypothetical protein